MRSSRCSSSGAEPQVAQPAARLTPGGRAGALDPCGDLATSASLRHEDTQLPLTSCGSSSRPDGALFGARSDPPNIGAPCEFPGAAACRDLHSVMDHRSVSAVPTRTARRTASSPREPTLLRPAQRIPISAGARDESPGAARGSPRAPVGGCRSVGDGTGGHRAARAPTGLSRLDLAALRRTSEGDPFSFRKGGGW